MTDDTTPQPQASQNSLRGRLREQRQEKLEKLYLDRPVPRMEEAVVRFKPLAGGRLEAINKQTDKSKDPDKFTIGAARSLAETCLGIYAVVPLDDPDCVTTTNDGRTGLASISADVHDDDDPVRFDPRLAHQLGLPEGTSNTATIVRAFYLTEGDIVAESNAITEWSGYAGGLTQEEYAGN